MVPWRPAVAGEGRYAATTKPRCDYLIRAGELEDPPPWRAAKHYPQFRAVTDSFAAGENPLLILSLNGLIEGTRAVTLAF